MKWYKQLQINSLNKKAQILYQVRRDNPVSDIEIAKEIAVHKKMAAFYQKNRYSKHFSDAEIKWVESHRVAANLNDVDSQYILSRFFFERGNNWLKINQSFYHARIQLQYAKQCFEEAYAYLAAAEEQGHVLARRLHGLALIHGWGQEKNEDQGFQLVIKSIKDEGSWDRATDVLKELGLNNPEFFEYIMGNKSSTQ